MKLDPRIKSLSDILTIFDIDRAKQFIGQKGYFADSLYCFDDLGSCYRDTLTDACDGQAGPFRRMETDNYQQFFIPESSLKPEEKKLRPYTLKEFEDIFPIGEPIKYRERGRGGSERYLILNGYWNDKSCGEITTYAYIGPFSFTLEDLFAAYEWEDPFNGDWRPFGAEVEE